MEGTHDLTHEQAIDMLIDDVRAKGIEIEHAERSAARCRSSSPR